MRIFTDDRNRDHRITIRFLLSTLIALAMIAVIAPAALGSVTGRVVVELRNEMQVGRTRPVYFMDQRILGTDDGSMQEYRFQRMRSGANFSYVVSNLEPGVAYNVQLSFVEHEYRAAGLRLFNVYLEKERVLERLDVFRATGGVDRALQHTFTAVPDGDGRITVRFCSKDAGCAGNAMISTIGISTAAGTVVEIDAAQSRSRSDQATVFEGSDTQTVYEALLGRLGSRFSVNLLSQKLGARISTVGDGAGDLSDLVIGISADRSGTDMRVLPFSDRFQVWENIHLDHTMTSLVYTCSSPSFPGLRFLFRFTAPFYPGDEGTSCSPFVYLDVTVESELSVDQENPLYLLFAQSHNAYCTGAPEEISFAGMDAYVYNTRYNLFDESYNPAGAINATEAFGVTDASGVRFMGTAGTGAAGDGFDDYGANTLWGYRSPDGYPRPAGSPQSPVFTSYPRGYSGMEWEIGELAAGSSASRSFVFAGWTADEVLTVGKPGNTSRYSFRYSQNDLYGSDAEPGYNSIRELLEYAVSAREGAMEKSAFFDSAISEDRYLSFGDEGITGTARELICYTFQSFLVNTWWCENRSGKEWFSTWEGSDNCRYHSTVDVEYNNAWFYLYFWPDLLETIVDEWWEYRKTTKEGAFLSHDMGYGTEVTGMAYFADMPVEENLDCLLMMYRYWKSTGDTAFLQGRSGIISALTDFVLNTDINGNGIPDIYCSNTIDQGTRAIQHGPDQAYLGVKALCAFQAVMEMVDERVLNDPALRSRCEGSVVAINQALMGDLWLGDHFAVALDGSVTGEERTAYSIYASNGLVYLMGGTRDTGITSTVNELLIQDLKNSTAATLTDFGSSHSSFDPYNIWISQNIWRDQAAGMLGTTLGGQPPIAMASRYWGATRYFAQNLWGGFWDSVIFPGGETQKASGQFGETATSIEQSLGYYPRGASSLGLIGAAAGLTIDRVNDALYYGQTVGGLRIPVFECADWENPDEDKRLPTLYFPTAAGEALTVDDGGSLPNLTGRRIMLEMKAVSTGGPISPNGNGEEKASVEFTVPTPASVTCSVWNGRDLVRLFPAEILPAGLKTVTWDGTDDAGQVVEDGEYTFRIEAVPVNGSFAVRPGSVVVPVNNSGPRLSTEWYFAEGYTGKGPDGGRFEEYILVLNPNLQESRITTTFMLPGGGETEWEFGVAPESRLTIKVNDLLPDTEVSTRITSTLPVAAERAMYFNGGAAGHSSPGVSSPAKRWYLPEGYTGDGFDEFILIQNPQEYPTEVRATFMREASDSVTRSYLLPPRSRSTVRVNDLIEGESVSAMVESSQAVVVERAQYMNDMAAGTGSMGAVSTSRTWYFAEGCTGNGFETWVLIQNPQQVSSEVTVSFMRQGASEEVRRYQVDPGTRFTIEVGSVLPEAEVAIKISASEPVVAERAVYWNNRSDGHASIGAPVPASRWYLPEGYTGEGFETFVLIQNPGGSERHVVVIFRDAGGRRTAKTYVVPARSRQSVNVNDLLPETEVSAVMVADGPIVVDRTTYFNGRSGGTSSSGVQ